MTVRLQRQGATAVVTLDSPETRNAFTPALKDGLARAVADIVADREVRAVVITGAGGHFCAGGDLRGMAGGALAGAEGRLRMQTVNRWIRELVLLDRPVIAAVDGAAFGGGFSVALSADFVLATPRARFCMPFLKLGLVPDCGASYTLPRAVGVQRARELMLSAREVPAAEALALGIVMELHEPDALLARALALAASFAEAAPLAVSLLKRNVADAGALDAALDAEANAQALAFGTAEHRAAVQRFLDKLPPTFQWPTNP
ncbi:MAG: enoyl-CoA hydratase/isomerase family protein [Burkholderiales bacterium]|nr:enoyl-CoA hydratase/isomerase family protein [Burkholderiales bacterium]